MKKLILLSVILISINAKPLELKQLFNKQIITVQEQTKSISKKFYAKTVLDETNIRDINLRFDGFVGELYANEEHKIIKKNNVMFTIYSKEIVSIFEELLLAMKFGKQGHTNSIETKLKLLGISKNLINRVKKSKKVPYYIDIKSKYNGIILNKNIYTGSYIKEGQKVFQIADISTIWIEANIYQKDLTYVKPNMSVKVQIEGIGSRQGKIDFVHPIINTKTQTQTVRINLKNSDKKILPNMFATVLIQSPNISMLTLPKSAVITKADKKYVFAPLENDTYTPKEITAILIDDDTYQITSGLGKNDKVINNALFLLDSDAISNALYDAQEEEW